MEKDSTERELSRIVDGMIGEANTKYGADLSEEKQIERRIRDIRLREELVLQLQEEIRCKKISERFMDESLKDIRYEIVKEISSSGINFYVTSKV